MKQRANVRPVHHGGKPQWVTANIPLTGAGGNHQATQLEHAASAAYEKGRTKRSIFLNGRFRRRDGNGKERKTDDTFQDVAHSVTMAFAAFPPGRLHGSQEDDRIFAESLC